MRDNIAIVGWSCRLPGASSPAALWSMLQAGHCAISRVPADRWSQGQIGHPRRQEPGKSYSWAAGVLDDVWGFDPTLFGIAPREAAQMDPQQRILLELTWEALEDAGIPPSSIAGKDVGVYIGGSSLDYGMARLFDLAGGDQYFATGNALAILANRISYIFNLRGPSFTVDTACSSSLVALNNAIEALTSGRIDTAIVGGINVLGAPFSFVSFSQASMLSQTGLCQAFSAGADGYVRAEGGVVMVLQRLSRVRTSRNMPHGLIVASDVNSDGRTQGISLPSPDAQAALLDRVYTRAGIDPNRLSFVEAHGTGTPVGDPIEAGAIGRVLGQNRSQPLLIGSIKTNIGHLEPASGLAGVMKAVMALDQRVLPPSLHFVEPNPNINFKQLNLEVCSRSTELPKTALPLAGVNSFGFGGTNAHVVVAPMRGLRLAAEEPSAPPRFLPISAESKGALAALASAYAERIGQATEHQTSMVIAGAARRRDQLTHRVAVTTDKPSEMAEALKAVTDGGSHPLVTAGTAIGRDLPLAFVYSGNGSQWVGMGHGAYAQNELFRAHFERVDDAFRPLSGWSLRETMLSDGLAEQLTRTSIAQPLIFAIQSATTAVMCSLGLRPAAVLGHSVGEVAAAEAAGILDLETAVRVIFFRSQHQELVRDRGRMAVIVATPDTAQALTEAIEGLEVAAYNSPRAITMVGPQAAIAKLAATAKRDRIVYRELDLEYPFHSALMAPIEERLVVDLDDVATQDGHTPFVSTVTGSVLAGSAVDPGYWWRNVREPVQFAAGLERAARLGARVFVEIGPRATLLNHITDTVDRLGPVAALSVLDRVPPDGSDPFRQALANVYVRGGAVDAAMTFGPDPGPQVSLPTYPWQHQTYRSPTTSEVFGSPFDSSRHPFAGARATPDSLEWRGHLDAALVPELADHKVGGRVVLPGAGLAEIAIAVGRQWLQTEAVSISQFDILQFLELPPGETREILTRVSPGSNGIEILSRPRLSTAPWTLHARGRVQHGDVPTPPPAISLTGAERTFSSAEIYGFAQSAGLQYGPSFQLLRRATRIGETRIVVELNPDLPPCAYPFHVDPMRLDACLHGVFLTFEQLRTRARGVGYVPIRFDDVAILVPEARPHRAVIDLKICNERSIVADFYLFDRSDTFIGMIRGARSQAVRTRQVGEFESLALVQRSRRLDGRVTRRSGVPLSADDIVALAERTGIANLETGADSLLLEGWATMLAYELASGLAEKDALDVDTLISAGRVPAELRYWLLNLLGGLESSGLAKAHDGRWTLTRDPLLPSSESVLATLAAEHASRAAELLLCGEVTHLVRRFVSERRNFMAPTLSGAALDFYHLNGQAPRDAAEALAQIVQTHDLWPADRALRVLQVGFGPLTSIMRSLVDDRQAILSVVEPDRRRAEQARLSLPPGVVVSDGKSALGPYDLIVAAHTLHRLGGALDMAKLSESLLPGGLMVAVMPRPSLFRDLVFGLQPSWFSGSVGDYPVGGMRSPSQWRREFESCGFAATQAVEVHTGGEPAVLLVSTAAAQPQAALESNDLGTGLIVSRARTSEAEIATTLATLLSTSGMHVSVQLSDDGGQPAASEPPPQTVIHFACTADDSGDPVEMLRSRCLEMKACADRIGAARAALWLIFRGALGRDGGRTNPVESAAWAFSRTLANEYPHLDVRRIDIRPNVAPQQAADLLRGILISASSETEFEIEAGVVRALRVEPVPRGSQNPANPAAEATRLERTTGAGQRIAWQPCGRQAPAADEVEIAVEATGLNFRDLMWSMSLLPDDMLEDGFAGASLGLECAGRVVRIGPGVKDLKPGDRVVALAPSAFASHVCIPSAAVARVPEGMSAEAAATIPVAFLTAYYSLMTQARLRRGEWVLIHGAAGGVGLAAIQIAQARGARIVATAGSTAKRDLLRSLGVAHVLNSRSTAFVNEVREITGDGVDVVLNSLAGEAMEKGLSCLRPFGRFVELGKRDYVANTSIGLRPFRKNLSYFGVDIDQLMGSQRRLGQRLYAEIMRMFKAGTLFPLPYRVFEAAEVADAFRLMQHSGHIGKIVVRPPRAGAVRCPPPAFVVDPHRTHLITGGFGGFGLATARWLVENGARHLVLVGRKGAASDEAKAAVAELVQLGVQVNSAACDVSDPRAVQRLFDSVQRTMPPLAGVIHGAMVLDDSLISGLDAERIDRVLTPKVSGAENLDRATRGMSLDYFVLFSSVTTLIGNPGQGSYVAANGYLEGLARRRRQAGAPALAIGWGPISDVGVVARNQRLASSLRDRGGAKGMSAREALALMGEALSQPGQSVDGAALTIAVQDWGAASERLTLLRSPTYAALLTGDRPSAAGVRTSIDLRALVAGGDIENARSRVIAIIVDEIARVLHLPAEDVSQVRPLGEIGLDSLMGLELAMALQDRFGLDIPLSASTGSMPVTALADQVIAQATSTSARAVDPAAYALAEAHMVGDLDSIKRDEMIAIREVVEAKNKSMKRLID